MVDRRGGRGLTPARGPGRGAHRRRARGVSRHRARGVSRHRRRRSVASGQLHDELLDNSPLMNWSLDAPRLDFNGDE